MDWTIIVIILQLIFLEGILSIDNAAVLGAMVTPLPDDRPVEWPKALQRFGHRLHALLGNQRTAALRVGLLGAYVGRGLMLVMASFIISNPWLKLVGAAYLIHLALDSLGAAGSAGDEGEEGGESVKQRAFWMTVLSVELMDLAFSVDNVVAAVSLSDKLWVVMIGVAIGILTMRFAAGAFSYLVEKEPVLQTAAYILVLNIGVELILEETQIYEFSDWQRFGISVATVLLVLAYSHFRFLHVLRPALIWISQGFAIINKLIVWLMAPIKGLFGLIFTGLRMIFARPSPAQ
jgi:tellurite resistance protein TerC